MKTPDTDLKQRLVLGVIFATLIGCVSYVQAEEEIVRVSDDEICDKSIRYSIEYMPETEATELHSARWKIIDGDRTDDMQKFVGLIMFEFGQRISYNMDEENNPKNEVWWNDVLDRLSSSCNEMLETLRGQGLSDEMGSDEVW